MRTEGPLSRWIDDRQARGLITFTRDEALGSLAISPVALAHSARRLRAKGRLVVPRRGFYVVVPIEHRSAGAPPPSWYVDGLMRWQGRPYYVGLLSAAALHSAAHQQPMEMQVVTDRPQRPILVGRGTLRFFVKARPEATPTLTVRTETGSMLASTPEATAFDLVRYVEAVGRIGRVAEVLTELGEAVDPTRLVEAADAGVEGAVAQRTGWILDRVGHDAVTEPLHRWLAGRNTFPVALRPGVDSAGASRDPRWNVLVNEEIEVET